MNGRLTFQFGSIAGLQLRRQRRQIDRETDRQKMQVEQPAALRSELSCVSVKGTKFQVSSDQ